MRLVILGAILAFVVLLAPAATAAPRGQLFIEWGGSFWPAHVVGSAKDGRPVIHYDGWDASWDEPVDASRMAHGAPDGALHVEWRGSWWPAEILANRGEDKVLVHYIGWGSEWDETVDRSRLRRLSRR